MRALLHGRLCHVRVALDNIRSSDLDLSEDLAQLRVAPSVVQPLEHEPGPGTDEQREGSADTIVGYPGVGFNEQFEDANVQ